MWRRMSAVTREVKTRNKYLHKSSIIVVASVADEMRGNRLRWLGRVRNRYRGKMKENKRNVYGDRKRRKRMPKKKWEIK